MLSSRRLAPIVIAVLALALPAALSAKPQPKCAKGAEKAGCKLPVGARYAKQVKNRSANGTLELQVTAKGVSVTIYGVWIHCTQYAPLLGDESGVAAGFSGKQRPKIGKTYTISDNQSRTDEDGSVSSTASQLTLNVKSAKQVVVKLHQRSETGGQVGCDGSGTWTLKRQ